MKTRLLASLILALAHVASAQDYHIRANGRYNLRAEPRLDGRYVETVPAGETLLVIGNFNRWLKISRNGAEVWMADWLGYTRVDSPAAGTASQPASDIDNCCFVDRQCGTDADWTAGYWAFQHGECAAPQQSSQQPTAGTPASHAPAGLPLTNATAVLHTFDFNNCCYMDPGAWKCKSAMDWERGYANFQNHVCVHPLPIGTRPATVGNAKFAYLVDSALELIRVHAPEWLNYIYASGAHMFEVVPPGQRGGFYNERWSIAHGWTAFENDDPVWMPDYDYIVGYAGGITHEACHAMQQRTHTHNLEGWRNEKHCVEAQIAVIQAINPRSRDLGWLRNTLANIENPEYWWW